MSSILKQHSQGRSDIFRIDPSLIEENDGYNVRRDYGDVKELEKSIEANGVIQPLAVEQKEGKIILVRGHRRLRAIRSLLAQGKVVQHVPVQSVRFNDEARALDLILSNDGKPLNQIEQGEAFERLVELGLAPKQIAEKTGKTQAHISNCRKGASAPQEVKDYVAAGKISASEVIKLQRVYEDDEKLVRKVRQLISKAEDSGKEKVTGKTINSGDSGADEGGEEGDFEGTSKSSVSVSTSKTIVKSSFNRVQEFLDSTETISEVDKETILEVLASIVG